LNSTRPTPRNFARRGELPPVEVPPELREHPRIGEYLAYAKPQRYPKPFLIWLEDRERIEAGKSIEGANLQRFMDDETYCREPVKIRVHRGRL